MGTPVPRTSSILLFSQVIFCCLIGENWQHSFNVPFLFCMSEVEPLFLFLKYFIYLFLERGEGREKHQSVVASHSPPHWGPGLQPRHVPWLGIESVTLWFAVLNSLSHASQGWASFYLLRGIIISFSLSYLFMDAVHFSFWLLRVLYILEWGS